MYVFPQAVDHKIFVPTKMMILFQSPLPSKILPVLPSFPTLTLIILIM